MNEDEFLTRLKKLCLEFDAKAGEHPDPELAGFMIYNFAKNPSMKLDPPWFMDDSPDDDYMSELEKLEGDQE